MLEVQTLAELNTLSPKSGELIYAHGYSVAGQGPRHLKYNPTSTREADGVETFDAPVGKFEAVDLDGHTYPLEKLGILVGDTAGYWSTNHAQFSMITDYMSGLVGKRPTMVFPKGLVQHAGRCFGDTGGYYDVRAYGTTIQSGSTVDAFNEQAGFAYTAPRTGPGGWGNLINSAAAGAKSVTLKTTSEISEFFVGQLVILGQGSLQVDGIPPNWMMFEYRWVIDIDVGTGVITLDAKLRNSLDENMPAASVGNTSQNGPARIMGFRSDATMGFSWHGGTFLPGAVHPLSTGTPFYAQVPFCDVKDVECDTIWPSLNKLARLESCRCSWLEIDKMIQRLEIIGDTAKTYIAAKNNSTLDAGTSCQQLYIRGMESKGALFNLNAPNVVFEDCTFTDGEYYVTSVVSTGGFSGKWLQERLCFKNCTFTIRPNTFPRVIVSTSPFGMNFSCGAVAGAGIVSCASGPDSNRIKVGATVYSNDGRGGRVQRVYADSGLVCAQLDSSDVFAAGNSLFSLCPDAIKLDNCKVLGTQRVCHTNDWRYNLPAPASVLGRKFETLKLNKHLCPIDYQTPTSWNAFIIGDISEIRMSVKKTCAAFLHIQWNKSFDSGGVGQLENGTLVFDLEELGERVINASGVSGAVGSDNLNTTTIDWTTTARAFYVAKAAPGIGLRDIANSSLPEFTLEVDLLRI